LHLKIANSTPAQVPANEKALHKHSPSATIKRQEVMPISDLAVDSQKKRNRALGPRTHDISKGFMKVEKWYATEIMTIPPTHHLNQEAANLSGGQRRGVRASPKGASCAGVAHAKKSHERWPQLKNHFPPVASFFETRSRASTTAPFWPAAALRAP